MYIHVVQTSGYNTKAAGGNTVRVSSKDNGSEGEGVVLREGDGVFVSGKVGVEVRVENVGEGVAEVLLFEMD